MFSTASSPPPSAAVTVPPTAGGVEDNGAVSMATLSFPSLIAAFRAASAAEMADFLQEMDRGMPLWRERTASLEAEAEPVKKSAKKAVAGGAVAPKKEKAAPRPKKEIAAVALPEAEDGAPDAAAYRLAPESIDHSLCLARKFIDAVHADKRWSPSVYTESQCVRKSAEGSDLCTNCTAMQDKCVEEGICVHSKWAGRVTEEPPDWVHMLGAKWATDRLASGKLKWLGEGGSAASVAGSEAASDAGSDSGSVKQMPAAASVDKSAAAAAKAEKAAAAAAEKAAAKAAKEAEKAEKAAAAAAEKAAAKAAKEAEKAAEKAAKAAAAAAEKAAAKPKKEKAEKPKKEKAAAASAATVSAKADTAAAVAEAKGELKLIDGTVYMVRDGNVYEYNDLEEKAGDFVGRLGADGESIDTDAEEVTGAESDSE